MAYIQKNNPFKKRSDLRAAKKEEKNFPQTSLTDKDLMGVMGGPSVREARKARRQLKKSIRKGTYKPTVKETKIGSMSLRTETSPGEALSESRRNIRIAKSKRKARKEMIKNQKNKSKSIPDFSKMRK